MDKFENALLTLYFIDVEEVKAEGKGEKEIVTKGFIDLEVYTSDGNAIGKAQLSTYLLKGNFDRHERATKANEDTHYWVRNVVEVSDGFPLASMMPYISMLAARGWEVVETKTNPWPAFAQALLKRKIPESGGSESC